MQGGSMWSGAGWFENKKSHHARWGYLKRFMG